MPYNGSGVFSRVYNWVTDKNNSVNITASRMDTEDNGFASGLSNCVLKDGTQTITANIPMSGFKFTGLAAGTANTDSVTLGQIQNSTANWIASGGAVDAITATYSPAITSLVDGMELDFRATGANITTTPTFSPSSLTAHVITQNGGSALSAGSIPAANFEAKLRYNLAGTRWELMNPFTNITIGTNVITNSNLSQMAANTIKSNITGSLANAADNTLTAIIDADIGSTQGDILYRGSSAWLVLAPGTAGKTLISGGAAANPSYTGPNSSQSSVNNYSSTTSNTGVMMGTGFTFTPSGSGVIDAKFIGNITNVAATLQMAYGTGTAPVNGAASTGTAIGSIQSFSAATGNSFHNWVLESLISGLTPGTAYWIDVIMAATSGGTLTPTSVMANAHELK